MKLGMRIRQLWELRLGLLVSVLLATFFAVWSVQRISLSPPSMTPRSFEMATASTHVVVDTPTSVLLDLRQDTYSMEALTNRAVLLGNVIATAAVRTAIAERARVPVELLQIEPPLTNKQPQARPVDGNQRSPGDLVESTDQYRLSIQGNPTVPILEIYAQAPTADSAAALANAAVAELRSYLSSFAASERTPEENRIQLVELGRAEGHVINPGVKWQVAILAFVLTLGFSSATVIYLRRVREGWLHAARAERLATD